MRIKATLFLALVVALASACHDAASRQSESSETKGGDGLKAEGVYSRDYGAPVLLAELEEKAVKESSGLAASRRNSGIIWTHNDSGDGPFLYAFDRSGARRGVWRLSGAEAEDWEDMAAGPGPRAGESYLYVGDIGDNDKERREITVYRVLEPEVRIEDAETSKNAPRETATAEAIRLRYPDGSHNAEALAVHPVSGDLYVITKTRKMNSKAGVYKLAAPYPISKTSTLEKVGEISLPSLLPGMLTGADISPDGRRVVLCDYFNAYELSLNESARGAFDSVWQQTPLIVRLGNRRQGEAVCYSLDGRAILATGEGKHPPLIEVRAAGR